ncbi:hypothetical protein DPMN_078920, partial [Dreissena polymorpha]
MSRLIYFHQKFDLNQPGDRESKVKFPAPGSHVFQTTRTIFKLVQYIIGTNLLTKFHEDRTINVAFRVLTRQMLTLHDAQHTNVITKTLHEHIVFRRAKKVSVGKE